VSAESAARTGRLASDDAVWATVLFALALAVRMVFLARMEIPPFDPWRHLALVRNLRDGAGFTLFDGQPYLWYGPTWHYLCAAFPTWFRMEWIAGLLSALCAPVTYVFMRRQTLQEARLGPIAASILIAAAGPVVAYTCHYGPEALALLLMLSALLFCTLTRHPVGSLLAGLAFGTALTLRLNFLFDAFLFLPWMRHRWRAGGIVVGTAIPLLLTWWRNHSIIESHPWVFTWDGLATRSADFNWLSTLVLQIHPAVAEALRRLHEQIVPLPEWLYGPQGVSWGLLLFVACGVVGLLASRRWPVVLAGGSAMVYFLLFDHSLSSHFFRIYLVTFPVFFIAIGLTVQRLSVDRRKRWAVVAVVALPLVAGAHLLRPAPMFPVEAFTPEAAFLEDDRYLVNSSFFHPESLIYRYPDKQFIGLPVDTLHLDAFLAHYPAYRTVLWHDFSVQPEVGAEITGRADILGVRESVNAYGRRYRILPLHSDSPDQE